MCPLLTGVHELAQYASHENLSATLLCSQGLYSSVMCPGVVLTNLTYGILPPFVWTLLLPLIWLVSGKHLFFIYLFWVMKY